MLNSSSPAAPGLTQQPHQQPLHHFSHHVHPHAHLAPHQFQQQPMQHQHQHHLNPHLTHLNQHHHHLSFQLHPHAPVQHVPHAPLPPQPVQGQQGLGTKQTPLQQQQQQQQQAQMQPLDVDDQQPRKPAKVGLPQPIQHPQQHQQELNSQSESMPFQQQQELDSNQQAAVPLQQPHLHQLLPIVPAQLPPLPMALLQHPPPLQHSLPSTHDLICLNHLYHNGYLQGLYTDLVLRIQINQPAQPQSPLDLQQQQQQQELGQPSAGSDTIVFKLHRIMAIRSATLAGLLHDHERSTMSNGSNNANSEFQLIPTLALTTNDPNITSEGLGIAIGHLYSSYVHSLLASKLQGGPLSTQHRSSVLRSVFAAAHLLNLPDLAAMTLGFIKDDVSTESVLGYCQFVSSDGAARYGAGLAELREAVFGYLCKGVLAEIAGKHGLIWQNKEGDAYRTLVSLFSGLPFEWLKRVVESKAFEVPTDMERYSFAKETVQLRSRHRATGSSSSVMAAGEESVLLAFGGGTKGSAANVAIVRKASKVFNMSANNASQKATSNGNGSSHNALAQQQGQQGQQGHSSLANGAGQSAHAAAGMAGMRGYSPVPERRIWKASN
ncbi:hypothetical protein BC831DRAFT_445905 [Entophlyctis helioformis]|nr:hypothetical protein BC831DRAFT_445905 [Entophlyctis helioformis]